MKVRTWAEQQELEARIVRRMRGRWVQSIAKTGANKSVAARLVGLHRGHFRRLIAPFDIVFSTKKLRAPKPAKRGLTPIERMKMDAARATDRIRATQE